MKTSEEIAASLEAQGISNVGEIFYNLSTAELYEHALNFNEAQLSSRGALVAMTVPLTGRSPNDKFFVEEESSKDKIWWMKTNKPFPKDKFQALKSKVFSYLQNREIYLRDCLVGADKSHQLNVRVLTENAWHNMFAKNMFIDAPAEALKDFTPDFTVVFVPNFKAIPEIDGTRSGTFIVISFDEKIVLIGGTPYSGEIKKSIFTAMNYFLPLKGALPMHCSANIGKDGDTALFFGLSGTGKTTLSTDPERRLIGDDEHGWDENGVFNFEGGCYAKVINLSAESEPIIYKMTQTFGSILENVVMDPDTREVDFTDDSITENTRVSYSRELLDNIDPDNKGPKPKNIIFLTADAFGVMPPISRLTPEQAMYHFLSGYTAKVAGTEAGLKEPSATFSTCFGGVFMVHKPAVYANLLRDHINESGAQVWLVNTGWSGGEYGVGKRMSIGHTRALLRAALNGELNDAEFVTEPNFGLSIPTEVPGVPTEVLNPRNTWADKAAYDAKAKHLVGLFEENFKQHADGVSEEVRNSMKPRVNQTAMA
jgi:phosphoenolpyruvate carboxykinase (ATP)